MSLDLKQFKPYRTVVGIDVGNLLYQRDALLEECKRLRNELKTIATAAGSDSYIYIMVQEALR